MATSLISDDCGTASEANRLFATEKGLLVLRPRRDCCCSFHFTVPSGCYALVASHGADIDYENNGSGEKSAVWPPGCHFPHPPWIGVSHLVTKQSVVLDLPVKACKTKDNVTVNIDVALVFRIMGDSDLGEDPQLVRNFVHELKPRGLEQQLRDAQEEAVRGLARSLKHTEIYGIRSGGIRDRSMGETVKKGAMGSIVEDKEYNEKKEDQIDDGKSEIVEEEELYRDEILEGSSDASDRFAAKMASAKGDDSAAAMRAQLNKQFIPQGVEIQSVMIKSINLPSDITSQMNEKTMIISQNAQQRMLHENEMQKTRMDQQVETLLQSFDEQRQQERTQGDEKLNEEQVKLNDATAHATKSVATIHEETRIKLDNIFAEASLKEQRVKDKMLADVMYIESESQRESAEHLANTHLEVQTIISQAKLISSKNLAHAQSVISHAEGQVAPWLAKKNEFEREKKILDVYDELANNECAIISGSNDDGVNLVAVADAILSEESKTHNRETTVTTTELMAEMALMSQGSSGFIVPSTITPLRDM